METKRRNFKKQREEEQKKWLEKERLRREEKKRRAEERKQREERKRKELEEQRVREEEERKRIAIEKKREEEQRRQQEEKQRREQEEQRRREQEEAERVQKQEEEKEKERAILERQEKELARERELQEMEDRARREREEAEKKNRSQKASTQKAATATGFYSYLPSSLDLASSLSSWVWGPTTTLGPLVRDLKSFRFEERRGASRTGPVWRGVQIAEDQSTSEVALKLLNNAYHLYLLHQQQKSGSREYSELILNFTPKSDDVSTFREAMILHYLSHPSIFPLKGLVRRKQEYLMILPYVEYDLEYYVESQWKECPTQTRGRHIREIVFQLIVVLTYLHSAKIVHRDIRTSSVLISKTGNNRIWLSGFSQARCLESAPLDPLPPTKYYGYRAPELILTAGHVQQGLPAETWKASDVWSCGVMFAQLMMSGKTIFNGVGSDKILESILAIEECRESLGAMPQTFSVLNTHSAFGTAVEKTLAEAVGASKDDADAVDLLTRMLQFDPQKRITMEQALSHPYFAAFQNRLKQKQGLVRCDGSSELLLDSHVPQFLREFCAGLTA